MTDVFGPCLCDGRYHGCDHDKPCGRPNSGTGHGPWCAECNPRRMAAIDASLHRLAEGGHR
jgi:hypothetical protein